MSELQVYSVKDVAINKFGNPFYQATKGSAIRTFSDAVNDTTSPFYRHPKDYQLFFLGTYNDATGQFVNANLPELVGSAADFLVASVPDAPLFSNS